MNKRARRAGQLAFLALIVGCGDDSAGGGGTGGSGGDGAGASGGSDTTGGAPAGGNGSGGAAAGGAAEGGAATGGSDTGGAGGSFSGGCPDLVGSCLASNGICSDYGVGGPDPINCTNAGFVWVEESCVTRDDAEVGAGCLGMGPPYCGVVWYPVASEANYPSFQMTCEDSGQTWIVL